MNYARSDSRHRSLLTSRQAVVLTSRQPGTHPPSLAGYSLSSWLMYPRRARSSRHMVPRRDLVGRSCDLFRSGRQEQLGHLCGNRRDLPRRLELGVLAGNGLTNIHIIDMLPGG